MALSERLLQAKLEVRWTLEQFADLVRYAPQVPENFRTDVHFARLEGERFPVVATLLRTAAYFGRALWCCLVDHRLRSDGFAGPDSGRELVWCDRCGKTLVDHWYY